MTKIQDNKFEYNKACTWQAKFGWVGAIKHARGQPTLDGRVCVAGRGW